MRTAVCLIAGSIMLTGCVTTEKSNQAEACGGGAPATALASTNVQGSKTYMSGGESGTSYDLLLSLTSSGNRLDGNYSLKGRYASSGTARLYNGSYCENTIRFSVNPASNPTCRHDFVGRVGVDGRIEGTFDACQGDGTWSAKL